MTWTIFAVAIGISKLGRTHVIPIIVPLAGKGTRSKYVSKTMNAAGLAMVNIDYHITSMDGGCSVHTKVLHRFGKFV